ncbi:Fe2+-dependent dioxygenase [Tardiphaga alba]|uniref:Fe2+-dependent dioxygenase n=1 Tax=Tardiphaga alba TaxID=340268 RepID=A0ABX8A8Y9_9BRAD|nr:Fe2+-dependent dioxygenase [Tardiphaga alba]QUS40193.1 Fe2+-dependent dioxygenase [Tardiphaga alba]
MEIIPDVLTPAEVSRCRELLDRAAWQDGKTTAGHIAARVKQNQQLAQDDPLAGELSAFVLEKLSTTSRFMAAALPLKVLPPRFNRYADSGTYGYHIDNAIFSVPGTPTRVRGDLSATLFLNDVDEYDGGELLIQGELATHEVKLPAGHMVLYPANTFHQVTPVTRGVRLASFFWIQSLVREANRRAMLLDLDDTIQDLAEEAPDSEALDRLTGLYHNLLREWSIT